jgi:hypothetical protein
MIQSNIDAKNGLSGKKWPIIILILIAIAVITVLSYMYYRSQSPEKQNGAIIVTEKGNYKIGDALKIKIANNSKKEICFSSCYPYYFERNDGSWHAYTYENCLADNLAKPCLEPNQEKAFEISIPQIEKGTHRLSLPACLECGLDSGFKESEWLYSNDFVIN